MAELTVDFVSLDHEVWSGAAKAVTAPAYDGELGILPDHTPVLAALAAGQVRITPTHGDPMRVRVSGGFLSVDDNHVTVVTDGAWLEETERASH